jgi:predicted unusual protein kinase regulating ubiquinone biosynthesis (AarF/ABC1/UbiB family)
MHLAVHGVRRARADEAARAELDAQFAIRTAEDVAATMGQMKGALMKVGQLLGVILETLPDEARAALATLQADAPPMAPSLAEQVVREELGDDPDRLFREWEPVPVAAASIGQVHRAVTHAGQVVAVKVQYPGVDRAIKADLDNAELLYGMVASLSLKGLDVRAVVDELRARMAEELDYRIEATNQQEMAAHYAGHPFVRIPAVLPELSSRRVLSSEWADGMTWAEFLDTASEDARQRAGEVIWRFSQASIHRLGCFNGDPHPGNYRLHHDGSVTFLDFGMVKRWSGDEWARLTPCLHAIVDRDADRLVGAMEDVGFLDPGHGLDPRDVLAYVGAPYRPYLVDEFTFTPEFVAETVTAIADVRGPLQAVVAKLDLPPSFVVLNRVVWGVSALLGRLGASGPWRAMLLEYTRGGPPATELGVLEQAWRARTAPPLG